MPAPQSETHNGLPISWTRSMVLAMVLAAVLFAASAGSAFAQKGPSSQTSAAIDPDAISFNEGLQPMIDRLSAQGSTTEEEVFTLAGAQFLRGVENALQTRYRYGATQGMLGLALMQLGLPANPEPEPFSGAVLETLFSDVDAQMDAARETLGSLGIVTTFTVPVDVSSIWFDIDADGTRSDAESLPAVMAGLFGGRRAGEALEAFGSAPVVDFDQSDAAWLTAYTHVLSATANLVLALQPADIIDEVFAEGAALDARFAGERNRMLGGETRAIDTIVAWILVLEQVPLAENTSAAREHMLALVAENRVFWDAVATETDQRREWIPSPTQTSALPITFPGEIGPAWLAVLDDLEALLEGRLLAPHWRLGGAGATHGINIATFLEEPQSTDILGLIQGRGVLFAVEEGPVISDDNWQAFRTLVGRGGSFFPFLLN